MDAASIVNLISAISPYVTGLIQDAEGIFGSGNGQQKQQFVVGAISNAFQGVVTGAAATGESTVTKTVNAIAPALPNIVNMFVAVMNALGAVTPPTTPAAAATTTTATPVAIQADATQATATGTAIPGFPTAQ